MATDIDGDECCLLLLLLLLSLSDVVITISVHLSSRQPPPSAMSRRPRHSQPLWTTFKTRQTAQAPELWPSCGQCSACLTRRAL